MKKFTKILLYLTASSILFTGCIGAVVNLGSATVGTALTSSNVKNTQTGINLSEIKKKHESAIILYRIDRGGIGTLLNVKANGINFGTLPTNAYIIIPETSLKSNKVNITITANTRMKSSTLDITLEKGKIYYADIDTISLVGVGVIKIELVEENDVPKRFRLENLN